MCGLESWMFLVLFFIILVPRVLTDTAGNDACYSSKCSCHYDADHALVVACRLTDIKDLRKAIKEPRNVTSLDLSQSSISGIPERVFENFSSLINLSLSSTTANCLSPEVFYGLNRLQNLNFQPNKFNKPPIFQWDGNFSSILKLHMLHTIRGVACDIYGRHRNCECSSCDLVKNISDPHLQDLAHDEPYVGRFTRCIETSYTTSASITSLARHGVRQFCSDRSLECGVWLRYNKNPCFELLKVVLNIEYAFGMAAIILNGLVIVIVISKSPLRKIVSMLFTANMALGDFFVGVNAIFITVVLQNAIFNEFHDRRKEWCTTRGLLWPLGNTLGTWTSAFLTTERFVAVKYAMNPQIRIRNKLAFTLILVSWIIALASAVIPMLEPHGYLYHKNDLCMPFNIQNSSVVMFVYTSLFTLPCIVINIVTIPLYLVIFRIVKTSSNQMGVCREGKVAKKIAPLVISNTIFFILPLILFGVFVILLNVNGKIWGSYAEYFLSGPVMLFSFNTNAVLNPLLYSFRNPRFQQALKDFIRKAGPRSNRLSHASSQQGTSSLHTQCRKQSLQASRSVVGSQDRTAAKESPRAKCSMD